MESSKRPMGLFKGRYIDSRPQRNKFRFSDLEQIMGDEDWVEEVLRYTLSVKVVRADEGERTLSGSVGKGIIVDEIGLQGGVAMDDEQKGRV